jgi:hypothetical protein
MKKITFLVASLAVLLNLATTSLAAPVLASDATNIENQQGFGSGGSISTIYGDVVDPRDIVANIIVGILTFIGIIFIILIIVAGFKYMTSMGNEEQTGKAKAQIISAVIGVVIIFVAYILTSFVFSCLLGATTAHEWTTNICSQ